MNATAVRIFALMVYLGLMITAAACMPYLKQPGFMAVVMGWCVWQGAQITTALGWLKPVKA